MSGLLRRILLIQLRQLGDILLSTPAIRVLKKAFPRTEVSFLSHPMGRQILEDNPYLDEHILYRDGVGAFFETVKTLRSKRYDAVFDFMANPRSALFTLATQSPVRIAFQTSRKFVYTQLLPRPPGTDYVVRDKLRLLRLIGIESQDSQMDLPWHERHCGPFLRLMGELPNFRDASLRVVLSPTHRRLDRRWPIESYARLGEFLAKHWNAAVIWAWGPGEQELVEHAMRICKAPTIVAPKTSLREIAALLANCDLFVGNSNGLSHVAVAVKTPSMQLHGPTMKTSWSPLTLEHHALEASMDGLGPLIEQLPVEVVIERLSNMEALVRERAAQRRKAGPRLKWSQ